MNPRRIIRRAKRRPRRGAVLIALLAVFAIFATVAGVWARSIVRERRQQRLQEELVQVRWLAEAGVRRAAARLSADPAYVGETWQIEAPQLSRPESAAVVIRVEATDGPAGQVRLVARAVYPRGKARMRQTKTVVFNLPGELEP